MKVLMLKVWEILWEAFSSFRRWDWNIFLYLEFRVLSSFDLAAILEYLISFKQVKISDFNAKDVN